jgi:hypothetical protein
VNEAAVAEADFGLGGVHIHIDRGGVHLDHEHDRGMTTRLDQAAVGLLDRVLDGFVADDAAVQEDVLGLVGGAGEKGETGEAPDGDAAGVVELIGVDLEHLIREFGAEDGEGPLARGLVRREIDDGAAIAGGGEGDRRMGHGEVADDIEAAALFGLGCAEELAAGGAC